jgi:hypothetical protein
LRTVLHRCAEQRTYNFCPIHLSTKLCVWSNLLKNTRLC